MNDRCEREIASYHKGNQAAAAGGRAKAWKAVDKAIRVHVRAGQPGDARGLLIDFVSRHGHDDDTRAVDEMISSLERDAHQAQVQLDLIGQAALDAAIRAASAHSMAEAGEHSAGTQHEEVPHVAGSVPAGAGASLRRGWQD